MSTLNGGPGNIVTNGLILYLDAANYLSYVSGSTTWRDISSSNLSGSLINGPTFSSGNGGSIVFDGVDDFAPFPAVLTSASAFTVGLWLYNTDSNIVFTLSQQPLAGDGFPAHNRYSFEANNKQFTVYGLGGNDYDDFNNVTPFFTTGSWFYQVYQWDSSHTMKMFLNGVQQSGNYNFSGTRPTSIANSFPFRVGLGARSSGGTLFYFKGNIPIVQVYNRTLSASEILQNYNSTKARFGL